MHGQSLNTHIGVNTGLGVPKSVVSQGQILAVWILAAKLPNSDLNFAVDFWGIFSSCFSKEKAQKIPPENPPQNSPRVLIRKIPLGFLQRPFLEWFQEACVPSV